MDLINAIRRENGFDQTYDDPETMNTINALRGNASRGLEK